MTTEIRKLPTFGGKVFLEDIKDLNIILDLNTIKLDTVRENLSWSISEFEGLYDLVEDKYLHASAPAKDNDNWVGVFSSTSDLLHHARLLHSVAEDMMLHIEKERKIEKFIGVVLDDLHRIGEIKVVLQ